MVELETTKPDSGGKKQPATNEIMGPERNNDEKVRDDEEQELFIPDEDDPEELLEFIQSGLFKLKERTDLSPDEKKKRVATIEAMIAKLTDKDNAQPQAGNEIDLMAQLRNSSEESGGPAAYAEIIEYCRYLGGQGVYWTTDEVVEEIDKAAKDLLLE